MGPGDSLSVPQSLVIAYLSNTLMKISRKLTVEIDGAKFHFEPQKLNDWATITKMGELDLEKQVDLVLEKLHAVEGVQFEDGEAVTLEMVKGKEVLPGAFYTKLAREWSKAIIKGITGEAEEGKSTAA